VEKLRRRAVRAVEAGVPQIQVALELGVSRRAVGQWVRAFRELGEASFRPGRRGRRPGERLSLADWQQERLLAVAASGPPDTVGLPWLLWTRRAVAELIRRELAITLSTTTVARYLARWGIVGPGPDVPPPGTDEETAPRAAVGALVSWAHVTLPGGPGHALIAVTDQEILHFLLSPAPFTQPDLEELKRRLRMQTGRDVELTLGSTPTGRTAQLAGWLDTRR
jgi:transposase